MYVYMGQLTFEHTKPYEDWFWKKNRIDLVFDRVTAIHAQERRIELACGGILSYDDLVIATGSRPRKPDCPGKDIPGVQGLYSLQDLAALEQNTKGIRRAVIVGGGLIGVEMAEMLFSRGIQVTMLVREPEYWSNVLPFQDAALISQHLQRHGVDLRLDTRLHEILPGHDGRVSSVTTDKGDAICCEFVGLTVGVEPNVDWLRPSGIEIGTGVLVDEYLRTSTPHVYAAGDCAERRYDLSGRKRIEQAWYTGRLMGEALSATLCGEPTPYDPGPWYNSAKFFEIEYQTYGEVRARKTEDEEEYYWEHPDGNKAIHLVWEKRSRRFRGINAFGIRLSHTQMDTWLRDGKTIDEVINHLDKANFDPEFSARFESIIQFDFRKNRVA